MILLLTWMGSKRQTFINRLYNILSLCHFIVTVFTLQTPSRLTKGPAAEWGRNWNRHWQHLQQNYKRWGWNFWKSKCVQGKGGKIWQRKWVGGKRGKCYWERVSHCSTSLEEWTCLNPVILFKQSWILCIYSTCDIKLSSSHLQNMRNYICVQTLVIPDIDKLKTAKLFAQM